jgi:hypothetical protein
VGKNGALVLFRNRALAQPNNAYWSLPVGYIQDREDDREQLPWPQCKWKIHKRLSMTTTHLQSFAQHCLTQTNVLTA